MIVCFVAGSTAEFSCKIVSEPAATVKWLCNNKPMDEKCDRYKMSTAAGDYKLVISKASAADSGLITVCATNHAGSSTCSAQLMVQPKGKF